jgi:predicted GIY-YIG superfamily endonuclease
MHSPPHFYYIYIMTNRSKTLYTGVTGHLERRVFEPARSKSKKKMRNCVPKWGRKVVGWLVVLPSR